MRTILTIWTQPRKTFEYLDNNEGIDPRVNLDVLFYLGSLAMVIPAIPGIVSKFQSRGEPVAFLIIIALYTTIIGALLGRLKYALFNVILVISLFQGLAWGLKYWMQ